MKDHNRYNKRIRNVWPNILLQPLCAVGFMLVLLLTLNSFATSPILWAVGSGSLASSCYLVFGQPSSISSSPRRIVGGYLIGIAVGEFVRLIVSKFYVFGADFLQQTNLHAVGVFAALAVGGCLVVMALLDLEHPPAAGMTLVLILDVHDYYVLAVIMAAALILAVIRFLLRKHLRDLNVYCR